ncbi:glycoside hydrolase family 3 C-terminal domain-containing protein [Candidatus Sulfidibacterium hydrothermale]|uniref:glycoside hydrolase family 3 N-terminal domain-containing protein n=1 Tax=Candidatus Sulfidibacterium hydrothermale TaxID=2875962 RepID=UPI001F0ADD9D|nr:glycoside hydrolase family 3 N-terminal domain-containing protein [Candidatus Sulfidibacterium hydrothermale]UBM63388.1 glycoside hydrolase family 3 C-terminal domain-containing protein [Candidatus Sulfidibacterium hydrothermale]
MAVVFSFLSVSVWAQTEKAPAYLNPNLPVNQRVDDLMKRMTLQEKIGQMCQYVGLEHVRESIKKLKGKNLKGDDQYGMYPHLSINDLKQLTREGKIGSFLHVKDAREANELQRLAMQSRLKIPLLLGIDAIHGHALIYGATVYPTQLSLSSSWDDSLLYQIAKATAAEVRATGMHWTFSPNVEIARDPRWGRTGETFGEDPFLVTRLGVDFTEGYQGNWGKNNILACAKHMTGGGEPFNGLNAAPLDASERRLRNVWLPPYKAQVEEAHVYTIMAAHNEISGTPCHENKFLLTDVLRNEWGFQGFVVSDWMDMERIYTLHHAAPSYDAAYRQSIEAGMDMHMHGPRFLKSVEKSVETGKLDEKYIDNAARKILYAKFKLGLFDSPFVNEKKAEKALFTPAHQKLALRAAREDIILLKNNGLLPLKGAKKILVTGPNANNQRILGDWAYRQPDDHVTTVYEGFKEIFSGAQVDFINSGESLLHPNDELLKKPVSKAAGYDAVIVVVGSNSLRYDDKEKNCGENVDRGTLNLMGNQLKLIKEIYAKNKNVVVVFVNGRPLAEPWIKKNIPAIIEAWEPGAFGGQAIAEVVKGTVNPSGKLTITIPYSVGQVHMIYNHLPSAYLHKYVDIPSSPLWHFGYGISYTTYKYAGLQLPKQVHLNDTITASVKVTNTGNRDGVEIVQLYIRDDYSTATRPVKELKAYQRVLLKKGETRTVTFHLPVAALAYYNAQSKYVVEPGTFTIMVGSSSRNKDLLKGKVLVIK